jgi:hypothetical protein
MLDSTGTYRMGHHKTHDRSIKAPTALSGCKSYNVYLELAWTVSKLYLCLAFKSLASNAVPLQVLQAFVVVAPT